MVDELICPDCGGVVGATEHTEAGAPCRCFTGSASSAASAAATTSVGTLMGTEALAAEGGGGGVAVETAVAAKPAKICRLCGADLTGQRRYKDHAGYYCADCNKQHTLDEHQGRVRCGACGHLIKPESLTEYEGTKMCPSCYGEKQELKKQQIQRLGFKAARTREDFRQVLLVAYILLGLVAIIAIGAIINHFRGS